VTIIHYSRARNPEEIPSEINKGVAKRIIIKEHIDLEFVKAKIRRKPLITLKELAEAVQRQCGVKPGITHLGRFLRTSGISRIAGSRQRQVAAGYMLKDLNSSQIKSNYLNPL
jgi:hypothetical protein